jgi:hypothetical protein
MLRLRPLQEPPKKLEANGEYGNSNIPEKSYVALGKGRCKPETAYLRCNSRKGGAAASGLSVVLSMAWHCAQFSRARLNPPRASGCARTGPLNRSMTGAMIRGTPSPRHHHAVLTKAWTIADGGIPRKRRWAAQCEEPFLVSLRVSLFIQAVTRSGSQQRTLGAVAVKGRVSQRATSVSCTNKPLEILLPKTQQNAPF